MARSTLQRIYDALPGTAQDLVLRVAGVRSYRLRFGADFRRALGELGALDGASADAIASDQERRLRQTVSHAAATVPYYRELFRRAVAPEAHNRGRGFPKGAGRRPPLGNGAR